MLEVDGLAIVLATLGEERRGESERREAAGVVAQLTSPWVEEPACPRRRRHRGVPHGGRRR